MIMSSVSFGQINDCDNYIKQLGDTDLSSRHYVSRQSIELSTSGTDINGFKLSFDLNGSRNKLSFLIKHLYGHRASGSYKVIFIFDDGTKCNNQVPFIFSGGVITIKYTNHSTVEDQCRNELATKRLQEIILDRIPGDHTYHLKVNVNDAKLFQFQMACFTSMLQN